MSSFYFAGIDVIIMYTIMSYYNVMHLNIELLSLHFCNVYEKLLIELLNHLC